MHINNIFLFRPQCLQMILLQPIQQWLCNFDESIFIDENLLGRQTFMGSPVGI